MVINQRAIMTKNSENGCAKKENVLFLTPTMTEDLMNYNDELINILTENNIPCGNF